MSSSGGDCFAIVASTRAVQALDHGRSTVALTEAEVGRAIALAALAARADFMASHRLIRHVAAALVGGSPDNLTLVQQCPRCSAAHGAPRIAGRPELFVSLSRRPGVVAAAAARSPVAIDIESWCHAAALEELDGRIFGAGERRWLSTRSHDRQTVLGITPFHCAALRLWVRKECMAKLGRLNLDSLAELELRPSVDPCFVPPPPDDGAMLRFTDFADRGWRISGAVACSSGAAIRFLV